MMNRRIVVGLLAGGGLLALGVVGVFSMMGQVPEASASAQRQGRSPCPESEAHEFDFLIGEWDMAVTILNADGSVKRRIQEKSYVEPVIGGCALIDDWNHQGFTVRSWDPGDKKWRLIWTDNGPSQGHIQWWEGTFVDGVGTFIGGDRAPNPRNRISSKIEFSEIEDDSVHWEMFKSLDNGKTWLLTDIREYTRVK